MVRTILSWLIWPVIFVGGLVGAAMAFQCDARLLWFNVVYFTIVAVIAVFERIMPYEPTWLAADGETFNNIAHSLLSKGAVQLAATVGVSLPIASAQLIQPLTASANSLWPVKFPMIVQVGLGLLLAELGLYAAHRLAHEYLCLWRFHALHHSVTRLWVINTGRFHFIDSLFKIALSQIPLFLLGAPLAVFLWIAAVTAFVGLLTHCNIAVRTGLLDYVFSTPRLHRWHHSKELREGNTNYGENLVIWDLVFGTYHNPDRLSSIDIGITGRVSRGFIGQIIQPFSRTGARQILGKKPGD